MGWTSHYEKKRSNFFVFVCGRAYLKVLRFFSGERQNAKNKTMERKKTLQIKPASFSIKSVAALFIHPENLVVCGSDKCHERNFPFADLDRHRDSKEVVIVHDGLQPETVQKLINREPIDFSRLAQPPVEGFVLREDAKIIVFGDHPYANTEIPQSLEVIQAFIMN